MLKKLFGKDSGMYGVVSIALVLFSAHAGGGFATGNQANTYFVGLGWTGIVSAVIAMVLLTAMLKEAMFMYNSRGLKSYKELFETLYHPFDKLELVFEVFYYIMVVMVVATTISGSASALKEYFGFNYTVGVVLVSALTLLLVTFGASVVRVVGSYMGLVILVTSLVIYAVGSFKGDGILNVLRMDFMNSGFDNLPKAVMNGFIYAGFQCVQIPAMVACGGVLKSKSEVSNSMKLSAVINALALGLSVAMLLSWKSYYTSIDGGSTIPTLTATKAMGYDWMTVFYATSLILCLVSSAVSITFGFVARFESASVLKRVENEKARRLLVAVFILAVSMLISMAGLTNIIKYGYGYCGYVAIVLIVVPFLTVGVYKNRTYGRIPATVAYESVQ